MNMKNIAKSFRLFFLYASFSFRTTFQARLGIIFFLLGKLLRFVFVFILIFLLFSKIKFIKGYTLDQAIVFYLTYNLVDTLSQILFREAYRFRPLVVSGGLDLVLLKPFHPFIRLLFGGIDFLDLVLVIPYCGALVYYIARSGHLGISSFLLFTALVFNSLVLAMAFHIIVLGLGILTTEVDHTIMIYRDITSLGRFPMEIYREPIRGIFTYAIPVAVMMSFPAKAVFGVLSTQGIIIAFAVAGIGLICSLLFWHYALRRYQSWGG